MIYSPIYQSFKPSIHSITIYPPTSFCSIIFTYYSIHQPSFYPSIHPSIHPSISFCCHSFIHLMHFHRPHLSIHLLIYSLVFVIFSYLLQFVFHSTGLFIPQSIFSSIHSSSQQIHSLTVIHSCLISSLSLCNSSIPLSLFIPLSLSIHSSLHPLSPLLSLVNTHQ